MAYARPAFISLTVCIGLSSRSSPASARQEAPPPQDPPEMARAEPETTRTPRLLAEKLLFEEVRRQISATRREEPITLAPSTITVIDANNLHRSGISFFSDAFRMVPGLEVMRTNSTESNVNLRGYHDVASTSQGMLAVIDGRLAYNDFFGNVFWDALPVSPDGVRQIEVIRGPGSFVHGPNAMHGFVNIVTRSPLQYDQDLVHFSAETGSYDSSLATLTMVNRDEHAGLKATLSWDSLDTFEGENFSSGKNFVEVRYETMIDKQDDHRFELTGGVTEQKLAVFVPTLFGVPPALLASDFEEKFVKGNYVNGDFKAQVFWTGFDSASVPDNFYAPFSTELDTIDVDLQYSLVPSGWDGHTITMGSGYRRASFRTRDLDVSLGRHDTDQFWGFIQDEVALRDDLYLTVGVRLDDHSTSGTNPSPRVATVWEFQDDQFLRASAGFGFRNPSLRESWFDLPVTLTGLPGPVTIGGNDQLDAERIRSFELGYSGTPLARLKAGVNLYYNLVDDLIVFQPTAFFPDPAPPGTPSRVAPRNQDDEEAYGAEVALDYLLSDTLSAFCNYSYGRRRNRDTNDNIKSAPRHKGNLGLRMTTPDGFSAMLWANYFDDVEFVGQNVDSYTLLNGQVSYDFLLDQSQARVYAGAFNLLDNNHREHPEAQEYGVILKVGFSMTW